MSYFRRSNKNPQKFPPLEITGKKVRYLQARKKVPIGNIWKSNCKKMGGMYVPPKFGSH